ncbi:MAG: preprotein translocase subunit SecY [marine actinobacterium MedAcidi-G1]|nr:MAG: preprotein translocase subunit SecY [marine actinobacterium MedAcidi-G1]HAQ04163.1 preprotein translocase subunit SecY [Acidimicrobiaceae bacterium]
MLKSMLNMFRVGDLRKRILFTLLMILLYRIGAFVPAPGIDVEQVQLLRDRANQGGVLAFLQLFSGGSLTSFAVFALGVMPYITASIIMQVLGVVVPRIEQWQQQGAVGQRKITQWTRYMTVIIAVIQSTSFAFLFNDSGNAISGSSGSNLLPNFHIGTVSVVVLTLTAGTALLMWMGELITQKGIGNGMSLLIMISIISSFPAQGSLIHAENGVVALVVVLAVLIAIITVVVFVEQGQRRIPVQFAKRVVGRRMYGGQNTYIPLKVNQSGVIPIIFASSILYLPVLIAAALPWDGFRGWVDNNLAQPDNVFYFAITGLLVVGFAYFYTAITFDPVRQADTIRKQGGFVPGIRPGYQTERYLAKILSRITLPGALFLAAVALIPSILINVFLDTTSGVGSSSSGASGFGFVGISILIASGVALETMKQVDSQLTMRNYEGFLK